MLSQLYKNGRDYPVHNSSLTLNAAKINCSAFEREALGVSFVLNKFLLHHLLSKIVSAVHRMPSAETCSQYARAA